MELENVLAVQELEKLGNNPVLYAMEAENVGVATELGSVRDVKVQVELQLDVIWKVSYTHLT